MLTQDAINKLKNDWLTFEQIQELNRRIESIDNWTAKFLDEEEFWNKVNSGINIKMKEKSNWNNISI
jgi:hypothetical protein